MENNLLPAPGSEGSLLDSLAGAPEESLDPTDWAAFRAFAHTALDDAIDFMSTQSARPVWRPVPAAVKAELRTPVPLGPQPLSAVYDEFKRCVLPYPTGNGHPRFWGWVMGNGTPDAMVAEMLAAAMNPHVAGYDQSAALVEQQVLRWLAELLGFPADSSGVLVGGGTEANLLGLCAARNTRAGFDVRAEGLQLGGQSELIVYASTETHYWVDKSCEVLGLGRRALRRLPCDAAFGMDLSALRTAIHADRKRGARPLCVVGTAGTVNTGATDALEELAALCREEGIWFHIDGAFGALAALSPALRSQVRGLEQADSLAFDLHKWGYLPYGVGCTLIRDANVHSQAFAGGASYIKSLARGIMPEPFVFANRGIELSRSFRALKVWMALKIHGAAKWGRLIEQNVRQAQYLAARIEREPELELVAPVPLNIVCFRIRGQGLTDRQREALNEEVLLRIQESGVAVPSSTRIGGEFALRVAITNHRSRRSDFDLFIDTVLELTRALRTSDFSATAAH